jgi:hypothetical protein
VNRQRRRSLSLLVLAAVAAPSRPEAQTPSQLSEMAALQAPFTACTRRNVDATYAGAADVLRVSEQILADCRSHFDVWQAGAWALIRRPDAGDQAREENDALLEKRNLDFIKIALAYSLARKRCAAGLSVADFDCERLNGPPKR